MLKLKNVNFENIEHLTPRGIKSSMKDTIKVFQKVLDKIFNHILIIFSPSVAGCKEAITRNKNTKTGPFGKSTELEGDFSHLYSNCNEGLLLERAEKECKYTDFHESTF